MNLHDKPFDETTITKLKLFEDYAQAWIPTFIMLKYITEIHIFDFFAGTGYDKANIAGSPIRILDKIIEQRGNIFKSNTTVHLHLNEFDKTKHQTLVNSITQKMNDNKGLDHRVIIHFYNEDFALLFPKLYPTIKIYPSLVYLDQNGIKFLSDDYRYQLEETSQTDFLFFAASTYMRRFGDGPEFRGFFKFDISDLKRGKNKEIHRNFTNLLKDNRKNTKLKYYPFTLQKNKNIYGVIFGTTHAAAVDKFLTITWKYNNANGDSNFDIDNEANAGQLDMFEGKRLTKIESFQQQVRDKIMNGSISNNIELLNFAFESGHIGKHADEVVKKLKAEGRINYKSKSPCVTYNSVFKDKKEVHYEKI